MLVVSRWLGGKGNQIRLRNTPQRVKMEFTMGFNKTWFSRSLKISILLVSVISSMAFCHRALANIKTSYWPVWDKSNESNYSSINHRAFDQFLTTYVVSNHPSGINRFRYADVERSDKKKLHNYIKHMAKLDPRDYSRIEQKAYWLNLYNALTIQRILQSYPIKSLAKSSIKRKHLIKVDGIKLSLADIENRILRPIWQDHKVIFGLSCATLGCPNIQSQAYTARNMSKLLRKSAREFINHPRGLEFDRRSMQASRIFDWYSADFGDNKKLIKLFAHYADDNKALYLLGFKGDINYAYDARINAPEVAWPQ